MTEAALQCPLAAPLAGNYLPFAVTADEKAPR
jgi:uncharacterized protein (DUF1684 family)